MKKKIIFVTLLIILVIFFTVKCLNLYKVKTISKEFSKESFNSIKEQIINKIQNEEIITLENCDYKYSNEGRKKFHNL